MCNLEIHAVPVVATIRGTQFNLAVGPGNFARLAVLDGLVEFSNPQGSVLVAANEQASVKTGEPPRKTVLIDPLDAVQWSLYYPDVADESEDRERAGRADPRFPGTGPEPRETIFCGGKSPKPARRLTGHWRSTRMTRAPTVCVPSSNWCKTARRRLGPTPSGRWPPIRLARGASRPESVQQAAFDLDGALASARQAVKLDPDDPQALIQESRLLFGMGRIREAPGRRKGPATGTQDAVVTSTWGFLQLTRGRVKEASQTFQEAIDQNSTLGEPHLGLGLTLFRQNQTDAAMDEMSKATLLDPRVSLYNSYLGKAYHEIKDNRSARKYLRQPGNLTRAIQHPISIMRSAMQGDDRPVEAVRDLEKAIELNDNRAVYHLRLLLDDDMAARGARLGYLYRSLGLERPALLEGWQSWISIKPTIPPIACSPMLIPVPTTRNGAR